MKQKTLGKRVTLSGVGLHTGVSVDICFQPAPEDYGYRVKRLDIEGQPVIKLLAENVVSNRRSTVIGKGEVTVGTVEHALAALYALGIDNCQIDVNAPEFPIMDGSAIPYVEAFKDAGVVEQEKDREYYIVRKKMEVSDSKTGAKLTFLPDDGLFINSFIDFGSKYINSLSASFDPNTDFTTEIAPARTFVFVRELEELISAGLIKGGNLDNAVVIYDEKITQERLDKISNTLSAPHHNSDELGYLNGDSLKFQDEPARHKLLDILGDLALVGMPVKGRLIAYKPGHKINNSLARLIRKDIRLNEVQPPIYDPMQEPIMDNNRIRELLPHRYPFQLVDKVIEITDDSIVGVKNMTANEEFFTGHFPQEPVMPGVLQVEAMAQTGGILVLSRLEDPEQYSTYFLKIDNVKFRQKVVPGDTLIFKVQMTSKIRRGIATMRGLAFIGDKVVSEADFTAQVVKNG